MPTETSVFIFMVYLTIISVSQTVQRRMVERSASELERMWKDAVFTSASAKWDRKIMEGGGITRS
jgi:chaperonin GroEL (HSP60 family)